MQMAPPDSESTIAGKTHSEILSMERWTRSRWYKMISREEKKEAMGIVETARRALSSVAMTGRVFSEEHRAKLSASMTGRILSEEHKAKIRVASTGRIHTEETRAKISAAKMGKPRSEETKAKISAALTGENHPFFGTIPSKESNAKRSAAWTLEMRAKQSVRMTGKNNSMKRLDVKAKHKEAMNRPERRAKLSAALTGRALSEEHKVKIRAGWTPEKRARHSATMMGKYTGENSGNWKGGTSFEPYCPAFNEQLKESIRNRDNRTCVLCGKNEIQNGRRLSVHHIDSDKTQGCNGKRWYLCALCRSCNSRPDTDEKEFLIVTNQNRIGGRR